MRPIKQVMTALVLLSTVAAAQEGGWSGDAGFLLGNHDNFFFRGPGASAPSSDLQTVFFNSERTKEGDSGELTFVIGADAVMVSDIDDADFQMADIGLEYKRGRYKYGGTFALLVNRLYVEEGEPVFYDERAFEGWARYSISKKLWVRAKAEVASQDFDPAENDRDADVTKLELTARYALSPSWGARVALLWSERDATGPRNNRTGSGFSLGLEGRPSDNVGLSARFRRREREYSDAPLGDRNFDRDDTVTDVNLNLRWTVRPRWGVELRNEYRDGESTRPDRNFDGNYLAAGLFVKF